MDAKLYRISFRQCDQVRNIWEIYIPQIGASVDENGECKRCKMERVRGLSENPIDVDVSYDLTVKVDQFIKDRESLMQSVDEEFEELIEKYES
jgi:hypothetical protein